MEPKGINKTGLSEKAKMKVVIAKDSDLKTVEAHLKTDSIYTNMLVRTHEFMVDETIKYGGEDLAPDPFDYIVAGLASCTAITMRQYAQKHDIPLKDIDITTQYRSVKPEYYPNPKDEDFRPHQMIKFIKLHGDLSQDQIDELMKISESPAHKMLANGVQIFTFNEKD